MARATQGLSPSTLKGLQSLLSQRSAASGRPIDPNILESVFGADIKAQLDTGFQREQLAETSRRFEEQLAQRKTEFATQSALTKQQLEDAAQAAKIQGAIDITSTGLTGYLAYKEFTAAPTVLAPTGIKGISDTTATGLTAATAGTLTAGEALTAGTVAGSSTLAPATGASAVGTGATEAATSGISGTTIGTTLAGAAVGIGVSLAVQELGGNDEASALLGGAAAGFVAGGPVGAVIGGVVGLVGEFVGDSVGTIICTELNRQGFMSDALMHFSHHYRVKYLDDIIYKGYLKLAKPVVKLMQKSRLFTHLIKPLALGYALEVAHRIDNELFPKGSKLGKLVMKIGIPLCRKVGQNG